MGLSVDGAGSSYFDIGHLFTGASAFDYTDGLVFFDGTNFGHGTITPFNITNFSGEVTAFLTEARVAALQLIKAHKKLGKAEKKAKKKDVKPKKFKPVKKAEMKVKSAANSFLNVLNWIRRWDEHLFFTPLNLLDRARLQLIVSSYIGFFFLCRV